MPTPQHEFRTPASAITVDMSEPGAHLPTGCYACQWAWSGAHTMRLKAWSPQCIPHSDVPVTTWAVSAWTWEAPRETPVLAARARDQFTLLDD